MGPTAASACSMPRAQLLRTTATSCAPPSRQRTNCVVLLVRPPTHQPCPRACRSPNLSYAPQAPVYVEMVTDISNDVKAIDAKMGELRAAHDARVRLVQILAA